MVRALSTALGKHGQNAEVYLAALKKMCRPFVKIKIKGWRMVRREGGEETVKILKILKETMRSA